MKFRIKDGVNLEDLRKYGFELGSVLKQQAPYDEILMGCDYKDDWWLAMEIPVDEDTGEFRPNYDDGDYRPTVEAWVDTRNGKNLLWFDATPECTYHIGMDELHFMVNIIYEMMLDGIIEKIED